MYRSTALGMLALVVSVAPAPAQQIDPHFLYEEKCGDCHEPHAGVFVVEALRNENGTLVGNVSGRSLKSYLDSGHGRLSPVEIVALLEQFDFIKQSGQVFYDKCIICHDNAKTLARIELKLDGDRLVGRYTGRDIADFLHAHGRLSTDEVTTMIGVLKRQLLTDTGGWRAPK